MTSDATTTVRLTQYGHGGGCACKIPPGELEQMVAGLGGPADSDLPLLVGLEHSDDAAAVQVRDDLAVLSTTDFFTPVVDDAYDWGRIAATNALSDVYAMGGRPVLAVNLLGWPRESLPTELAREVLRGGADVARAAGYPAIAIGCLDADGLAPGAHQQTDVPDALDPGAMTAALELCLGLVHYTDGVEGSRKRLATARKFAPNFSIATECGFGRRDRLFEPAFDDVDAPVPEPGIGQVDPDDLTELLRRHRTAGAQQVEVLGHEVGAPRLVLRVDR